MLAILLLLANAIYYGQYPHLIIQLQVDYTDGTQELITTDSSWKSKTGPIVEADMLMVASMMRGLKCRDGQSKIR
jgi:hypothetical protein